MNYVKFRGVSTQDIGALVDTMPPHKKPPMRYTEYVVQGKNGSMHTEEGYDAFDLPVTCTMFRQEATARDAINAWADGTGQLVTSDMPDRCWIASVLRPVDYQRREYGKYYDKFTVTFRCQPIMREVVPTVQTFTKNGVIANLGDVIAHPLIVVEGAGDVEFSIAGQTIILHNVTENVTIDSEAGYVYTPSGAVSMIGEFPVLPLGESNITIVKGVVRLNITPNWGWL